MKPRVCSLKRKTILRTRERERGRKETQINKIRA
jgi:hypothetical protein